jgi:predicted nuclease with TOPRIM domain
MAKVTKTYQELIQLANAINILSSSKEHVEANTKGVKKLQKIGTKIKSELEAYNEKLEDLRLDNAHTDESGALILDEKGGYKFSKDGLKKLNKDIKKLLEQTFEFYQFTFSHEGIENYGFLDGWVEGLSFPEIKQEDDDVEEAQVIPMGAE